MMRYIAEDGTLRFKFTTRQFSTGAPFTLAGTPSLSVYPEDSTTQITAGITLTVDYDSVTGLNDVVIDLSASASYAAGKAYQVVIAAGTVDSVSVVGETVYEFYIHASGGLEALITRGLLALPAAAADAAGGLVISDAGGFDIDNRSLAAAAVTNANTVFNTDFAANYDATNDRWTVGVEALDNDVITAASAAADFGAEIRALVTGGAYALDTDANGRVRIVDGTGAGELDTLTGTVLLRSATQASIDAIEADTNELQTDWVDGGRLDLILDSILVDTAEIGVAGAGLTEAGGTGDHLTALPWNAAWDAEVQSEVQDAIEVNNLDHLLKVALDTDFDTTVQFDSVIGYLAHDGTGTGTGGGFYRETDSLEAISQAIADLSLGGGSDWSADERTAIRTILGFTSGGVVGDPTSGILDTIRDAVGVVDGIVDTILIDTNELQTDWTNGGRLDLILDAILDDTDDIGVAGAGLTEAGGTGDHLTDLSVTLKDGVTHGGTSAMLRLGSSSTTAALHVTNSVGTAALFNASATTVGHGLQVSGGTAAAGLRASGGGSGIDSRGLTNGSAIYLESAGTGNVINGLKVGTGQYWNSGFVTQMQSGLSTHSAADVWSSATRTLSALDEDVTTIDLDATVRAAVGMASADLDTQLDAIATDLTTALTRIGSPASSLAADIAALNDLSAAEVNAEVDTALADINLDHLLKDAVDTDFPTTVHANSVIGYLADNGAGYDRTTDSLEAVADALITAALNVTKTKAAVYDSVSRSGSVLTLSNGATQTISSTGRATVDV